MGAGARSGGTGDLGGAGWDLYTSGFAELAFVDTTMNTPPMDPGTGNPDPMNPDPGTPGGDDGTEDDGGCSTGRTHGTSTLLLVALVSTMQSSADSW